MGEHASRGSSWFANLLLLSGSLLFVALLFALLEGGLRLVGIGAADAQISRLKYQQIPVPVLQPGARPDGSAVLHTYDVRLPYQSILRSKQPGSLRVFTFGGSATAGLGFSPNVTFARQLSRMLARAYPDRPIEVMNLGIVALASRQVKQLVADVIRGYEPDLLVVYSGNNEFLEVHAEKYAAAHATWLSTAVGLLQGTNFYRLVNRAIRGGRATRTLAEQNLSHDDLRLTQARIIEDIEMTPDEVAEVVDQYEANVDEIAEAALASGTPLILMTVASNWEWRGREDLPDDWLRELTGEPGPANPDRYQQALELLDARIPSAPPSQRYDLLFRRARARQGLGDHAGARADYREAMNQDPHLRRALDGMADRVREVARRRGARLLDTIELLSSRAQHGIVGFDEFYDYVHFTPRGVVLVAGEIFREMQRMGLVPPAAFDVDNDVERELARLAALEEDPFDVNEWLGFGRDPAFIRDRDLWKYDRMLKDLDARLAADPRDLHALVYRANAQSFRIDGAGPAARDYRAALEIAGDQPVIERNLERLLAERSP